MAKSDLLKAVKAAFDELATDGVIGSTIGQPAAAYIRVSSEEQADDGRSGLPRQLSHIHEAALKHGYRIPFAMVFADDFTGFEFEDRPGLTKLRKGYKSGQLDIAAIVMEHLDRLSRNNDWHSGYLLHEFKLHNITDVFWKPFSSRIERAVMGAIAQDGMEQAKERMWEGNLRKARSGRVTARVPAYGYKLVDANGNEGQNARKDTYYAVRNDEAAIVREIFARVIAGDKMRGIAVDLQRRGVRPPKQYRYWEATQLRLFIKNEVYRGDFYAHRWEHTTVLKPGKDGIGMVRVKCKVERPKEVWIHIPVPAIVSVSDWELANRMLEQNERMASRNANEPYLLTGLIRCVYCGWRYVGITHHRSRGKPRKTIYRGYHCQYYNARPKHLKATTSIACRNSFIPCAVLDTAVWHVVCQALLEPGLLLEALEADHTSEHNRQLEEQVSYLVRAIADKHIEDEKLYRAYLAGAFDEREFAAQRQHIKGDIVTMTVEADKLRSQLLSREQLEARKDSILQVSQQAKAMNIPPDPPFELKRQIIKLVVDDVVLDVKGGWFRLEGAIRGMFPIGTTPGGKG